MCMQQTDGFVLCMSPVILAGIGCFWFIVNDGICSEFIFTPQDSGSLYSNQKKY